jgi:DNA repair protein RecN (Recombination protein N)
MLSWIRVRNIAVIEELQVDFGPGLNLLTGETGAGKTILIDALSLILGARASTELVRTGAEEAFVEAAFELQDVPQALVERLSEAGIDLADTDANETREILIRRELPAGKANKGRISVNSVAAAASLLRDIAPFLVDIHGQGESATLARTEAGVDVLDQSVRDGRYQTERQTVADAYRKLVELEEQEAELSGEARDADTRREFLAFQLEEITRANPQPGEDEALHEERRLLAHGERLRALAEGAYGALYEEEDSALSRMAQVWKQVEELAEIDEGVRPFLASREAVSSQLDDLALFLRDYRERIESAPGRLDEVELRLAELERLKRKFGGDLESVLAHRAECEKGLARLQDSSQILGEIREKKSKAAAEYLAAARALGKLRKKAAKSLQTNVLQELRGLAMEKARFVLEVHTPADAEPERGMWRSTGLDAVELGFSANPGEDLRPLSRIASGGELSRFMLALKSVAAGAGESKTLVFDEVDAGIGGRVADVVGDRLKSLSRSHQVICVTHLPQIASFADVHFRIEKKEARGRSVTSVQPLDRKGRVDEIARMLAGSEVTESARRHAEALVAAKS